MTGEDTYRITVDDESDRIRLDKVLSFSLPEISRSYIQKLIERGFVRVNGQVCLSKKQAAAAGDELEIRVPEAQEPDVAPENITLNIVYEDEDLLVVDKQKGMVVHPGAGNLSGTLVNAVLFHCRESLSSINGVLRPGIVHRIDKDTTGLLVIAKNDMSHRALAEQFAEHSIIRAYKAIVYDNFSDDSGTVDAPIGRDPRNRLRQAVTESGSRRAVTNFRVAERFGRYTLIEARLETGRTHQIRVHMAYIGHPVLGDYIYGPRNNPFGIEGQILHAYLLGFVHPATGNYIEFESPLPDEFKKVLEKLRKNTAGRF